MEKSANNEWEITFEEIHRQQHHRVCHHAIFKGNRQQRIYRLLRSGSDDRHQPFLEPESLFLGSRQKYVLLGVTGPNEYENNVNNNWYTNYSCVQCLQSTIECLEMVAHEYPEEYNRIRRSTEFRHAERTARWKEIIDKMYLPKTKNDGIFVQDERLVRTKYWVR